MLVHTLDDDGDPSNGIRLSQQVQAAFAGVSARVDGNVYRLMHDPAFRGALNALNTAGAFASHRVVRPPWLVMHHEYDRLGLPQPIVATRYEEDSDNDGTLDRATENTHSAMGYQTRYDQDANGDGTIVRKELPDVMAIFAFRRYDHDGNDRLTQDEVRRSALADLARRF